MGFLFALLGLAEVTSGSTTGAEPRVFGSVLLAFGLLFAYRGFLSATVIVNPPRVTTRGFARSHVYKTEDLVDVEVRTGRTGFNGYGREYLALRLKDGSWKQFTELNAKPAGVGEPPTLVRNAVEVIRGQLGT